MPLAGIEPALLAELDFESSASTNSATGAPAEPVRGDVNYTGTKASMDEIEVSASAPKLSRRA